jgi:hypothetical protein
VRNPVYPGRKLQFLVETVEIPVHFDKNILKEIFGILPGHG